MPQLLKQPWRDRSPHSRDFSNRTQQTIKSRLDMGTGWGFRVELYPPPHVHRTREKMLTKIFTSGLESASAYRGH